MRFRPRVRPENFTSTKQDQKTQDPVFSEKELFYRDNIDLDMDMQEVRMLFRLAEDGADIEQDVLVIADQLSKKVSDKFGEDTREAQQAKDYLLQRVLPGLVSNENVSDVQNAFLSKFIFTKSQQQQFLEQVKTGKEKVASLATLFEKVPALKQDLEQIVSTISKALRENDVKKNSADIAVLVQGYISDLQEMHFEEEVYAEIFSHIAQEVAKAWGHDAFVSESMSKDYILIKQLGYGTSGEVYAALSSTGEPVAMKILSPRDPLANQRLETIDRDAARQFKRELIVLENVQNKHLVQYKDGDTVPIGKDDADDIMYSGWIAMEFIKGVDLKAEMNQKEKFTIEEVINIATQSLQGLAALHELGITHRDIKPGNIMVDTSTDELIIKLIDFGVAVNVENPFDVDQGEDDHGKIYGTPYYMAPEAAGVGEISPKVDIFSMGIILYELITKEHPLVDRSKDQEASVVSIVTDMMYKTPLPITNFVSGISPELEELILQMIAKEPNDRPTALEAISRLQQILFNESSSKNDLRDSLIDTRSIPAYAKSTLIKSTEAKVARSNKVEPLKKEVATLEEIAFQALDGYSLVSLTRKQFILEVEKLLGGKIGDEDVTDLLKMLKTKNVIQDNSSKKEGYIVVKNFEKNVQDKMNTKQESIEPPTSEPELDIFDTTSRYEKEGVSLDLAKQYFSANKRGTESQLQNDLSLSVSAAQQLLTKLDDDKFLSFDLEKGTYVVAEPKPVSLLSRIGNWFK